MSIRLRLTLFYTAILALTLIAFSSILYVSQTRATYESIKTNLAGQVAGFVRAIERAARPAARTIPDRAGPWLTAAGQPVVMDLSGSTLPGRWTQTRSITGTVMGQTPDLSGITLPLSTQGSGGRPGRIRLV